eukprot:2650727-Alexandrium_andersonii.AAC.1
MTLSHAHPAPRCGLLALACETSVITTGLPVIAKVHHALARSTGAHGTRAARALPCTGPCAPQHCPRAAPGRPPVRSPLVRPPRPR